MDKIKYEIKHFDSINETIYHGILQNGLEIYFVPKKGFKEKYAMLATRFGALDLNFIPHGGQKPHMFKAGIAHFLEHKMFEQPDGSNAFNKFSDMGLSANAFTEYKMTSYYFSGTQNFFSGLNHLINYVNTPYFTENNVEKEKGIIIQEMKMYEDNPYSTMYYNLLRNLYVNSYLNIDIIGTEESVSSMSVKELYDCYNTFYRPENMTLFVVGDLDFDEVVKNVVKSYSKIEVNQTEPFTFEGSGLIEGKNFEDITLKFNEMYTRPKSIQPSEPRGVATKEKYLDLDIANPIFMFAIKENKIPTIEDDINPAKKQKYIDLCKSMGLRLLFDRGSEIHNDLYERGLINDSFSFSYTSNLKYGFAMALGETKYPEEVVSALKEIIKSNIEGRIKYEDFELEKKRFTGSFIASMDAMTNIAHAFISGAFDGFNFMDMLELIKNISFEDVLKYTREILNLEASTVLIGRKSKKEVAKDE